jgi:hypothetical protein
MRRFGDHRNCGVARLSIDFEGCFVILFGFN